jgi:hypothetical protein
MAKAGWSKPLKVRYQFHLNTLAQAVQKYTPVGKHTHDVFNKRQSGRLKRAIGTLGNYRAPKGKNLITINIPLPYARMIARGGAVRAVTGKLMVFNPGGKPVYAKKRKGYNITGAQFFTKGYRDWIDRPAGKKSVTPHWV